MRKSRSNCSHQSAWSAALKRRARQTRSPNANTASPTGATETSNKKAIDSASIILVNPFPSVLRSDRRAYGG